MCLLFTLFIFSISTVLADVNLLVIGSATDSSSQTYVYDDGVASVSAFDPTEVVSELTNILEGADLGAVNVDFEDFHGISSGYRHANLFSWFHFPFPEDAEITRWSNLRGEAGTAWDYVVVLGDAHTIEYLPGFYALGVSEIAKEVAKGSAETVLLMPWPAADSSSSIDHYKAYRVANANGSRRHSCGFRFRS